MLACVRVQGLDFIAGLSGFSVDVFTFLGRSDLLLGLGNLVCHVSSESSLDLVPLLQTVLGDDALNVVEFIFAVGMFLGFVVGGVTSLFQIAS